MEAAYVVVGILAIAALYFLCKPQQASQPTLEGQQKLLEAGATAPSLPRGIIVAHIDNTSKCHCWTSIARGSTSWLIAVTMHLKDKFKRESSHIYLAQPQVWDLPAKEAHKHSTFTSLARTRPLLRA